MRQRWPPPRGASGLGRPRAGCVTAPTYGSPHSAGCGLVVEHPLGTGDDGGPEPLRDIALVQHHSVVQPHVTAPSTLLMMIVDTLDIDQDAFAAGTGWDIKPEG